MAGGIIVILGLITILLVHEAGHLIAAKTVGMKATQYFLGFGPTLWSFRRGETEYGIKAFPVGGYVRIIGMNALEEVAPQDEERAYRNNPFWKKSVVVMSGIASHYFLAFLLLWTSTVLIGLPDRNQPELTIEKVIPSTDTGSPTPAILAGIQDGDVVVGVNDTLTVSWTDLTRVLKQHPNEVVTLSLERGGEIIRVKPLLTSRTDSATGKDIGFLGVSPKLKIARNDPLTGSLKAVEKIIDFSAMSVIGIWQVFTNFGDFVNGVFGDERSTNQNRPISVIGIVQIGALSQSVGLGLTIELIAYISIFIAIVNAIPLHPFDGGHFALAIYEHLTGRQADPRKIIALGIAVFLLLSTVGLLALYLDIVDPIKVG